MLHIKLYSSQDECFVNAVAMAEVGCWYQHGVRLPAAQLPVSQTTATVT